MSFEAKRITYLAPNVKDRLVEDALEKINEGNTLPFKEDATDEDKKVILKKYIQAFCLDSDGFLFGIKKDGLLVALFMGKIINNVFESTYALFAKDDKGSRSYLYNPEWHDALKNFLKSQSSLFSYFEYMHKEGSPLADYAQDIINKSLYTLTINESSTEAFDNLNYGRRKTSPP